MFDFAATPPNRTAALAVNAPNESVPVHRPSFASAIGTQTAPRKVLLSQSTTNGWSIVPSANTGSTFNRIEDISCTSDSDCWAVGTAIQHWDGFSWSLVPAAAGDYLTGVQCNSESDCWAVGYQSHNDSSQSLIEHWNGFSWSVVISPNTSGANSNRLYDVTCRSASDCWAVGSSIFSTVGTTIVTLVEHWNGTAWAIVASPNDGDQTDLYGVTCNSASDCWAVGHGNSGSLIEHWDGSSWIVFSTGAADSNYLYDVTCTSGSDCWAVGISYNFTNSTRAPFIKRWNGASWVVVPSGSGDAANSGLFGVTCNSPSDCWAVGDSNIDHWDGSAWSSVPWADSGGSGLFGVTCNSASDCWAVGIRGNNSLIERWNGSLWSMVTSPNTIAPTNNQLIGLSCATASSCWAVGTYLGTNFQYSLFERWDGNSWAVANASGTSGSFWTPTAVTCASSVADCWAVGYKFFFEGHRDYSDTMHDHWNGSSWVLDELPGVAWESFLSGVTCASMSDCWAVGYATNSDSPYGSGSPLGTFIMHWGGASWATVPSPNVVSADNSVLRGVACVSSSDCWAVGNDRAGSDSHTLVEHWNGSSWAIVPSPNPSNAATPVNVLTSITCPSASDCWAAGFDTMGSGTVQTLIEHWNGSTWIVVSSPNVGNKNNQLFSVSCASGADCWAVGNSTNNASVAQTLTEHWNGSIWSVIDSSNTSNTRDNKLYAVSCVSGSNCWAAGYYVNDDGITQTLVEQWAPSLQVVNVVSRKAHGSAGTFDIDLANNGIECRAGGASGEYQIVATFPESVTTTGASVVSGLGRVSSTAIDGSHVAVNLTRVPNGQTITVRLAGVSDGTNSTSLDIPMRILFGDTTGDGVVNASDISQIKLQSGQPVSSSTFREDVTANGVINSSDVAAVKAVAGTALP